MTLYTGFEQAYAELGLGAVVGERKNPCRLKVGGLVRKLTTRHSVGKCIPRFGRLDSDDPCPKSRNWASWYPRDMGRVGVGER